MRPDRLTWLGHATTLVELGGARVLTDPVLRDRVVHLRRHARPPRPPGALDAILVSHLHRDHLDRPSLRAVDHGVPVVVPRGAAAVVRGARHADVREIGAGEAVALGDGLRVHAVPADHDGRRSPVETRAEALGYVIEGAGRRVYFAGDTALFAGMARLPGPVDAALLPVWGYGPKLGAGHMDPAQAAEALTLIRPRLAVPIHWGTFLPIGLLASHGRLLERPGPAFAERAAVVAPGVRVVVLAPGEGVAL